MTQEKIQALMKLYPLGAVMRKKSGSEWQGRVVGYYSTDLTPDGLAIESSAHAGSVQIYPLKALEVVAALEENQPAPQETERDIFEAGFIDEKLRLIGGPPSGESAAVIRALHLMRPGGADEYDSLEARFAWWAWQARAALEAQTACADFDAFAKRKGLLTEPEFGIAGEWQHLGLLREAWDAGRAALDLKRENPASSAALEAKQTGPTLKQIEDYLFAQGVAITPLKVAQSLGLVPSGFRQSPRQIDEALQAEVRMPEPVAKIYFDRKGCEVTELPGWEKLRPYGAHELVSLQQVRAMLAATDWGKV